MVCASVVLVDSTVDVVVTGSSSNAAVLLGPAVEVGVLVCVVVDGTAVVLVVGSTADVVL